MKKLFLLLFFSLSIVAVFQINARAASNQVLTIDGVDLLTTNEVELESGKATYDEKNNTLTLDNAVTKNKGLDVKNMDLNISVIGENVLSVEDDNNSINLINCGNVTLIGKDESKLKLSSTMYIDNSQITLENIFIDATLDNMEYTKAAISMQNNASLILNENAYIKARGSLNPLGIYAHAIEARNITLNKNSKLELYGGKDGTKNNGTAISGEGANITLNEEASIEILGYNAAGIDADNLILNDKANINIQIENDSTYSNEYAFGLIIHNKLEVNDDANFDIYSAGAGILGMQEITTYSINDNAKVNIFTSNDYPGIYALNASINLNNSANLNITSTKSNFGIIAKSLDVTGNTILKVDTKNYGCSIYLDDYLNLTTGEIRVNSNIRATGRITINSGILVAEEIISATSKIEILSGDISISKISSNLPATLFISLSEEAKNFITLEKYNYEVGEIVNLNVVVGFDKLIYANNTLVENNSFVMPNEIVYITIRETTIEKADYKELEKLVDKANALDKTIYKNFDTVEAIIEEIDWDKTANEQDIVDDYCNRLSEAINQLEYKEADYSRVNSIIERANSLDKTIYKDFSPVDEAIAQVVYGKDIREQDVVDGYAKKIEKAINELELKGNYAWYFIGGSLVLVMLIGIGAVLVIRKKNAK